jgi:DNA polymerase III alpha subunit
MINLRVHTEFHFDFSDRGYGKLKDVVARIKALGQSAAAITDSTTFGHVAWFRECNAAGIKPLLGAQIRIPLEVGNARVNLIARNNDGLKELYQLASLAASDEMTIEALVRSSTDVLKLTGSLPLTRKLIKSIKPKLRSAYFADISPNTPPELREEKGASGFPLVAVSENRYPAPEDRSAFALFGGAVEGHAQHLLTEREARVYVKGLPEEAYTLSDRIAKLCKVTLPKAKNMEVEGDLEKICRAAIRRRLGRWTKRYEARLVLELRMIKEKNFESYFLIISDMVRFAKKKMVVGPARGSAAGSLVCFLADITDVDPLVHGLLFERFIDVTRDDLPDIDLDFPDNKREMVIEYLRGKYGADQVVHLGTTLTLQPRSILRLISRRLDVKMWEFQPLLDAMIERSSGDSRAALCLLDTLEGMDAGKAIMARFPQVRTATAFEGHANATGTHAAGIIVCADPVRNHCTVDSRTATAQLDKHDAETINLLKIDILGLRTLSVLEYTMEQLPERIDLNAIPLEDREAFRLLNEGKWAGIFQFEGDAVQMLTKQMKISKFSDIVALGALARPGPLNSGGATEWAERRMGRSPIVHLHPLAEEFTEETYGIVVYQEQVMSIGRKIGQLDWADITELRRAMSKSKGEEFFNRYYDKFLKGALKQRMTAAQARHVWDHLNTMGSWSFNKSHAVSYGLISYWCAYFKAHYPREFAAATLRHTKGEEQTINLLRELQEEGVDYVAFDKDTSMANWQVINRRLTGGFLNLKGVGQTTADELVASRGRWTAKQIAKVDNAEVLYSNVFPARTRYSGLYADPPKCGFPGVRKLWTAREIDNAKAEGTLPDEFYFIGRLADKVPRDLNEYVFQVKRVQEGKPKLLTYETAYLNLVMEDDTGRVYATVNNRMYEDVGKEIVNKGVVGRSWYVFRGRLNRIRRINITWAKDITEKEWP